MNNCGRAIKTVSFFGWVGEGCSPPLTHGDPLSSAVALPRTSPLQSDWVYKPLDWLQTGEMRRMPRTKWEIYGPVYIQKHVARTTVL